MIATVDATPTRRSLRSQPASNPCNVFAIWGVQGSGKSTIALNIAVALAAKRGRVLLIDADTHAASQVSSLGLTDFPAGLAPLCRIARLNRLNAEEFDKQSMRLKGNGRTFTLVPGINPNRWPEITPQTVEQILKYASRQFDYIVIDLAADLEANLHGNAQPLERNAFTRWTIERADHLIVTACADPVSISRHLNQEPELQELRKRKPTTLVINRYRKGPLGVGAKSQITQTFNQLTSRKVAAFLPEDQRSADLALRQGTPLMRGSALAKAINQLAQDKKLAG